MQPFFAEFRRYIMQVNPHKESKAVSTLENIDRILKGCIAQEYKYQKMVYTCYQGFAMKIVFRYIYRHEQVVDVVNDGFVKLFSGFRHFKSAESEEGNRKRLMGYIKRNHD